VGRWIGGFMDRWIGGFMDRWIGGLVGLWVGGLLQVANLAVVASGSPSPSLSLCSLSFLSFLCSLCSLLLSVSSLFLPDSVSMLKEE
jgi:hypothetical protein